MDNLESAYIELSDCRKQMDASVQTAQVKSLLSGLSKARTDQISQARSFKVQFNPTTLRFTAGVDVKPKEKSSLTKNEDGSKNTCIVSDEFKPLTLQVQLIFDRSIYIDSSVQPEVEGFLAILKNPYIRQAAFHWGRLYYVGKLKNLDANYTMFNPLGIPVRATLDLTMEVF